MTRFSAERYWEETEPPWDQGDVSWIVRMAVRWGMTVLAFLAAREVVNWLWGEDKILVHGVAAWLLAPAVFVVIRAVLRPVLLLLTCPLRIITLGLFIFVINAVILLVTEQVCHWWGINFDIDGFWAAFAGAFAISAVTFVLSRFLRHNPFGPRLR